MIKIKVFFSAKDPGKRMERPSPDREKILTNHLSERGPAARRWRDCSGACSQMMKCSSWKMGEHPLGNASPKKLCRRQTSSWEDVPPRGKS